mmetsp:Transcript_18821/g.60000  ORF Transcript_18821/g.60000 Transcript_18821/m.60000 type:complete len:237 (-) Transcript_18821:30-740(-)
MPCAPNLLLDLCPQPVASLQHRLQVAKELSVRNVGHQTRTPACCLSLGPTNSIATTLGVSGPRSRRLLLDLAQTALSPTSARPKPQPGKPSKSQRCRRPEPTAPIVHVGRWCLTLQIILMHAAIHASFTKCRPWMHVEPFARRVALLLNAAFHHRLQVQIHPVQVALTKHALHGAKPTCHDRFHILPRFDQPELGQPELELTCARQQLMNSPPQALHTLARIFSGQDAHTVRYHEP